MGQQISDAFENAKGRHIDWDCSAGIQSVHKPLKRIFTDRIRVGDRPRKKTETPSFLYEFIKVDRVVLYGFDIAAEPERAAPAEAE